MVTERKVAYIYAHAAWFWHCLSEIHGGDFLPSAKRILGLSDNAFFTITMVAKAIFTIFDSITIAYKTNYRPGFVPRTVNQPPKVAEASFLSRSIAERAFVSLSQFEAITKFIA